MAPTFCSRSHEIFTSDGSTVTEQRLVSLGVKQGVECISPFMRLPAELRIRIYELLWDTSISTITDAEHGLPIPHILCDTPCTLTGVSSLSFYKINIPSGLAILFVNPQIYKEAATCWLRYTSFKGPARMMTRFLDSLRPECVSMIRRIEIDIRTVVMHRSNAIEIAAGLLYYKGTSRLDHLTINLICPPIGSGERKAFEERTILHRDLRSFPGHIKVWLYRANLRPGEPTLAEIWTRDKDRTEFTVTKLPLADCSP